MKKLTEHRGFLTPKQVADGIAAARTNAQDLCEAAEVLYRAGFFAPASVLGILATEEAFKEMILLQLLYVESVEEAQALWKQFRHHEIKQTVFEATEVWTLANVPEGISNEELVARLGREFQTRIPSERRKQLLLYSNCLAGPAWTVPKDQIKPEDARKLLDNARECVEAGRTYSTEELELYKEYLSGIKTKSPREQKLVAKRLQDELTRRGLPEHKYLRMWQKLVQQHSPRNLRSSMQ